MSESDAEVEQLVNTDEDGGNLQPEIRVVTATQMGQVQSGRDTWNDVEFQTPIDAGNTNWMNFEVEVTSTAQSHVGHKVGLVQNVISSSRVSTYGTVDNTVGTLTTLPSSGDFPLLDGEVENKPWYNEKAVGQQLPEVGDSITLSMSDAPSSTAPPTANQEGVNEPIDLVNTQVSEVFIIYLYDEDSQTTLKKWKWSYSFSYNHESGEVENFESEAPTETGEGSETPVLEPVGEFTAGGNCVQTWTGGLSQTGY